MPGSQMRKTLLLKDSPSFRKYTLKDILEHAKGLFDRTLILPEKGCAEYLERNGLGECCAVSEESLRDTVSSGGMVMFWDTEVFPYKEISGESSVISWSQRPSSPCFPSGRRSPQAGTSLTRGSPS